MALQTARAGREDTTLLEKNLLRRLEEYVLEHLDESLNVAALARLAGLSSSHFSRTFTKSVGRSPYRFVIDLRLQRALELVQANQFRLADIAMMTGFSDQSHLARWVRRVHGVTLSDIKCRNAESDLDPGSTTSELSGVCP